MQKKITGLLVAILMSNLGICQANENYNAGSAANLGKSVESQNYYRLEKELQENKGKTEEKEVVEDNRKLQPPINDPLAENMSTTYVRRIETNASDILTAKEIRDLAAKYEGREVSIKELYQLINEINSLYRAQNYITAIAMLPPQEIEDGLVKIQLVEGKVGKIAVKGNKYTDNYYFTSRMSLKDGHLFKVGQLQKDLTEFNLLNDVQLTAELSPGEVFGTTDYVLKVQEPEKIQTSVFMDNAGSKETGLYRLGISWADNSLTGNRDALSLVGMRTNGVTSWSGSYNTPINNAGTKLGISYDENQSSIVAGPFTSLDIDSNSSSLGISLNQPLRTTKYFKLSGFIEAYKKKTGVSMSSQAVGDTEINTRVVGYSAQKLWDNGFWYFRHDLTGGRVRYALSDSNQSFVKNTVSLINQVRFSNKSILTFKTAGQTANARILPSTEKFTIGGMNTVRGYQEGFLSGSEGYFASLEYSFPVADNSKVRGSVFVDHGKVFSSDVDNTVLTSVGIGTVITLSPNTSLKAVLGIPLERDIIYSQHEGPRVHLFLQSQR